MTTKKDISKLDRVGTCNTIHSLLVNVLVANRPKTIQEIKSVCSNLDIPIRDVQGSLQILQNVDAVTYKKGYVINERSELVQKYSESKYGEGFKATLLKELFDHLYKSEQLTNFFNPKALDYNHESDRISLRKSEIPVRFSNFRNFLILAEVFNIKRERYGLLDINEDHYNLVKEYVIPALQEKTLTKKYVLSPAEFEKLSDLRVEQGEKAEQFVLEFEKQRYKNHQHRHRIMRISLIDVKAGYDILSFVSPESSEPDAFIEVKSYKKHPHFYWTRNEVETAKRFKDNYLLYLVDLERFEEEGYSPTIISNPAQNIFKNEEWNVTTDSWRVESK